jgi:two-component system chemotaxis sensor kinase CheA
LEETLQAMGVGEDLIQEALSRVNVLVSDIVTDFPKTSADTAEKNQEKPENHLTPFSDTSIRVDVGLLDKLMNQVGELVLVRNQVLQFTTALKDAAFLGASQRLNLITTELQEGVMKTRMQPIDNVWNKFPRVIRDLAQSCGKKARLEMRGKETELDRTIIEAIKDPLTHLARNAVDHGIETPGERAAAGKAIEGCITLHAYHEGGQVIIEITDDGGGMDAEKIKQRALQGGYITPEQAGRLSEREIQHLIFLPGFTTNDQVTHVSGRGVGMDVVKTNIERIGGTVDIQSKKGEGTTIKMRIPLTLAIIPALIVASGGRRYAIPQISLVELVRLEADDPDQKVEYIHNAPVYRLRGKLLPLVYLNRELKGALRVNEGEEAVNIVVLQADDQQFGLVVEIINDTEEIVVKPLGKQLKSVSIFAGATIMGDGFVALILDVMGLAQRAHVVTENQESGIGTREDLTLKDADEGDKNRQTLLLFGVGKDGRGAIPLSAVSRLEVFPKTSLEKSGNQLVIQHRNEILPLIHLSGFLQDSAAAEWSELLQVVVHTAGERKVGFVVDQILDIVEGSVGLQQLSGRDGVMGTAVVLDRVTDLVDVGRVLHLTGFNGNGFSKSKTEV